MSRPAVTVVVPFAGDAAAARQALAMLQALRVGPGDELILADNSGTAPAADGRVRVVRATGERSPAHARNVGAAHAHADWILFLDADTRAPAGLLDVYFATGVAPDVGALVGEVYPAPGPRTLAARYGASRNFLSQRAHMAHPFRPRAAAANLLVRRAAFDATAGFREGLRAAEDTDFCWRLQELGWTLELREDASVEHSYRTTIRELRRQWRAYAAGRAWLAREHPGFHPEPAITRAVRRLRARLHGAEAGAGALRSPAASPQAPGPGVRGRDHASAQGRSAPQLRAGAGGRLERAEFLALDVLLALDELVGFRLSNRPDRSAS